jgi:predicted component of type VI protein secretion system
METWARLISLDSKYESFDITDDKVVIGRGKQCHVRMKDELGVSSKHCEITREVNKTTGKYC